MRVLIPVFLALLATPAAAQVDPARIQATAETLAPLDADAARQWAAAELSRIGDACDCIEVANIGRGFEGAQIVDMFAFQNGAAPKRMVIVKARVGEGREAAMLIETARMLSREKLHATIVYLLLPGGDATRWGERLFADTAKESHWNVIGTVGGDRPNPPDYDAMAVAVAADVAAVTELAGP
jgi:hypothetical protein